jgi:hypothetical protein
MSAGGSSVSNVRGQGSHNRLQRLVSVGAVRALRADRLEIASGIGPGERHRLLVALTGSVGAGDRRSQGSSSAKNGT